MKKKTYYTGGVWIEYEEGDGGYWDTGGTEWPSIDDAIEYCKDGRKWLPDCEARTLLKITIEPVERPLGDIDSAWPDALEATA